MLRSTFSKKQNEQEKFRDSESNLYAVRNYWLMVLRQESFDEPRPNQEEGNASDQRHQVARDRAQANPQSRALAPADQ